jgi:hypothetical protein
MHHGEIQALALFDKPDPLDGPFFEETIYVTPSSAARKEQEAILDSVRRAARAIGLRHGPIHAECRVNGNGVYVLEVAARPIGGLCARALRFAHAGPRDPEPGRRLPDPAARIPLEELLLRHALGESPTGWRREPDASGVMMLPIPHRGVFRRVVGLEEARAVPGIDDVRITARFDQLLIPLPEGASYLGFIFASGGTPAAVADALCEAHGRLRFTVDAEVPIVPPGLAYRPG